MCGRYGITARPSAGARGRLVASTQSLNSLAAGQADIVAAVDADAEAPHRTRRFGASEGVLQPQQSDVLVCHRICRGHRDIRIRRHWTTRDLHRGPGENRPRRQRHSRSASNGVVRHKNNDCAHHRNQQAIEIQSRGAGFTKKCEEPAADHRTNDPQYQIQNKSFALLVHDFARDEASDKTQDEPA